MKNWNYMLRVKYQKKKVKINVRVLNVVADPKDIR